jgi:phosphoribosylaminoimidazolecarboxamide formyltransferase / IMP cyclohydrolase
MPRALLSVSDKSGLVPFARNLVDRGWSLLSTGGTARVLRDADLPVTEVSEVTGHPEILGGRVKTLHPAIHAGLLGRRAHREDQREMGAHGYEPIDLLVVNLYPFRETVARSGITDPEAIEQIDIGGPAMLRSAAKNHESVCVVVDPTDYDRVVAALDGDFAACSELRRELACKVFRHTSDYDAAIAAYLERGTSTPDGLPATLELRLRRAQTLRYGENPDQAAAFYREAGAENGLADLRQLHGKELSFNNLLDVDGALLALAAWSADEKPVCVIVKHTTPCGIAVADSPADAYRKALSTDPVSAFGSVVAFNREVTVECAALLRPNFVEAVVAPGFAADALAILVEKKNLRLLALPIGPSSGELDYKRVRGGFLVQYPLLAGGAGEWRVVSARQPTPEEILDLRFAWSAVAAVKSNAIVLARDGMTIGIGAGQMSRVDSARIAVMKASDNGHSIAGAVLASDAYFPFRDGVDAAAGSGVKAVVQPGGSIRDGEVIAAADEHRIAMIFTGKRLFRH